MSSRSLRISTLLFFSGLCALVYQVVWLRELRLVFGASTPASAAVLAVFMGGLGFGSLLLGKRADAAERPLLMYSWLELGISVSAALSPLLLDATRALYAAVGGSVTLGLGLGTLVRLLLSALVLLPPTLLMGGTLPAAARAATSRDDATRRSAALLYGLNTLGAVVGATLSTFVMLEVFGIRFTLWIACAINGLTAMVARVLDRRLAAEEKAAEERAEELAGAAQARAEETEEVGATSAGGVAAAEHPLSRTVESPNEEREQLREARAIAPFVLTAAGGVGFAFLLMELVWYRVLSPLLGGSSYTFGLILAVALLGIGLGGLAYTRGQAGREASLRGFSISCGLEALFIALPFALGDRIALLALFLRDMGVVGLWGHLLGWSAVTAVVVLPAALVAGYQFPLLIALLGRAQTKVGRHIGNAYAANTLGAILGSIAGGFLLFPRIGAVDSWKLAVWLLVALGLAALWLHAKLRGRRSELFVPAALVAVTLLLLHGSVGPTAVWRHSPIGAGRADDFIADGTRNGLLESIHERRRGITWEVDGRESTIGLYTLNDTAFLVNGKSDGSAILDGGTQVMGGVLGALLQPEPVERVLVIGLGTGSTAGWLAELPSVDRVDVVELEPAIVEVARICSPVNQNVLDNPKVNIIIGDAREVLLTTPERYDLIFSEPSNPYRAGVASLFTQEFYRAVLDRLSDGGVFIQWLQTYEIDAQSVRIVYTTLGSVFPSVESWRTKYSDVVLLAREYDVPLDVGALETRMRQPGYREALMAAWRAVNAEDVVARFVAQPSLGRAIATEDTPHAINTDDRNLLEFSIARALGRPHDFGMHDLQQLAAERGEAQPKLAKGSQGIQYERVYDAYVSAYLAENAAPSGPSHLRQTKGSEQRRLAHEAWYQDRYAAVTTHWEAQDRPPEKPTEVLIVADAYAIAGREAEARPLIAQLRTLQPIEAAVIEARLRWALRDPKGSWEALEPALVAYRDDPWPNNRLMSRGIPLAHAIAEQVPELIDSIADTLRPDFAVSAHRYLRQDVFFNLGLMKKDPALCEEALAWYEPHIPWERSFLERRVQCYELSGHSRLAEAREDLERFLDDQGMDFKAGLRPTDPEPPPPVPTAIPAGQGGEASSPAGHGGAAGSLAAGGAGGAAP